MSPGDVVGLGLAFHLLGGGGCSSCRTNEERREDREVTSARYERCVEPDVSTLQNFHGFSTPGSYGPSDELQVAVVRTRYVYRKLPPTLEEASRLVRWGPVFLDVELFRVWLRQSGLRMCGDGE